MDNLTRRQLVAAGVASGLAAAARPLAAADAPAARSAPDPPFALAEATIADLQDGMKSGKWTARSIAEAYLARIDGIDAAGPVLRAVIEKNPEALAIADALDRERREKGPRGPLHGVPILVKDNVDSADRMATTAGSLALVGARPAKDAFVVRQLREAGAVLLGKTNLSEWANIRSSTSTSGWSGATDSRAIYALDRSPCGSSSGPASPSRPACAAAVGAETDGSDRQPTSATDRRRQADRGPPEPQRHHPDLRSRRTRRDHGAPCETPRRWERSRVPTRGRGNGRPRPRPINYAAFLDRAV